MLYLTLCTIPAGDRCRATPSPFKRGHLGNVLSCGVICAYPWGTAGFASSWHKLESAEREEPQLRKGLHETQLYGIF